MTKLSWISGADGAADRLVGKGNGTYADTLNKSLRDLLTLSGLDPDADFAGFLSLAGGTLTGALNAAAGIKGQIAVRKVSANATLTADDQLLIVDATSGAVTVTVPAASGGKYGWTVVRADSVSANTVTVQETGSDTLVGSTSLAVGESMDVATDGVSKVYTLSGRAASGGSSSTISASNVTAGEFPANVSFAGDAAFKNPASFASGAFFNQSVVFKLTSANGGSAATLSYATSFRRVLTLNDSTCVLSFANANQGATIEVLFKQDATGGRAITWPSGTKLPTGFAIATDANAATLVRIWYDGSLHWVTLLGKY